MTDTNIQSDKPKSNQKLIIVALLLLLVAGGGFAAFKYLKVGTPSTATSSTAALSSGTTQVAYTPSILLLTMLPTSMKSFQEYRRRGLVARVRSDLRNAAVSEEALFVDTEQYHSCTNKECETILPGLRLSYGVNVEITANASQFIATAWHDEVPTQKLYWDSNNGGLVDQVPSLADEGSEVEGSETGQGDLEETEAEG